jgi:anti-sigma factor RsiW
MNCERYRDWMTSAAADELQENRRGELENHARECAACRQEFQRVRTLMEAIDLEIAAHSAAEPSPKLMEQVRQCIREEVSVAPRRNARWVPAVACAAVLIVAASVWTLWPRTGARHGLTASSAPSSPVQAVRPAGVVTAKPKITPQRRGSMVALARPARKPNARRIDLQPAAPEVPEVIVQPGQMEAIIRFEQALNAHQIDGAKLLADQKKIAEPLEINPLTIAPLKIAALNADSAQDSGAGGTGGEGSGKEKDFVSGWLD